MNIVSFLDVNNKIKAQSPDAVLLTPLFLKETLTILNDYKESGILVSTFNDQITSYTPINFVGQDLFRSGTVAAQLMHKITKNKGKLIIIHIDEPINNAIHLQNKERGFRDYFNKLVNNKYEIITLKGEQEKLNKQLSTYFSIESDIEGIFITTSKSYKIVKTIEEITTQKIKVIGYDLLKENTSYLNQGKIDFLINQKQEQQVFLAITYLAEHFLYNKTIPDQKLLPIEIVCSENLGYVN